MDFEDDGAGQLGPTRNVGKDDAAPKGGGIGRPAQTGSYHRGRSGDPGTQPRAQSFDKGRGKGEKGKHHDASAEGKGKGKSQSPPSWGEKGSKGVGKGTSESPRPSGHKGAAKGGRPAVPGQIST